MLLSVLLVTEPMPFSLHDQELAVGASRFSGLPPEEKRIWQSWDGPLLILSSQKPWSGQNHLWIR